MPDSVASKTGGVVDTAASVEKQNMNADELRLAQMGEPGRPCLYTV